MMVLIDNFSIESNKLFAKMKQTVMKASSKNLTFQRRPKVLVWSTRLIINFSSFENIMKNGAFAPKEQMFHFT